MHAALQFTIYWTLGFFTLSVAVVLLNIFGDLIESDMELLSLGRETILAAVASLIEAAAIFLIVWFIPAANRGIALRAMIVPLIAVALIYKVAHLESWSLFEAGLLLAFQIAIACIIAALVTGHFGAALMVLVVFGIILAFIGVIAKSLWG